MQNKCKLIEQALAPNPVLEVYKKDIDRTLIREKLKLSPEERLLNLMHLQRFAHELRHAGRQVDLQDRIGHVRT